MPHFSDLTEEQYMATLRGSRGYQDLSSIAAEVAVDPAEIEVEEIKRQYEWYEKEGAKACKFDEDLRAWKVAAYFQNLEEKDYTTTLQSCNCERGIPCVHWYAVSKKQRINYNDEILIKGCRKRLQQEKQGKGIKRKADLGRKGPTKETHPRSPKVKKSAIPIHFAPPKGLISKSTATRGAAGEVFAPTRVRVDTSSDEEMDKDDDGLLQRSTDVLSAFQRSLPKSAPKESDKPTSMDSQVSQISGISVDNLSPVTAGVVDFILDAADALQTSSEPNALDIDNYTPQSLDKYCQLKELEGRYIVKNQQDIAFVKADFTMKATVIAPNDLPEHTQKELRFMAGKMIQQGQRYDAETRRRCVDIAIKLVEPEKFTAEAEKHCQNMTFRMKGRLEPTLLNCVCNTPEVEGVHQNFNLSCNSCQQKFHTECIQWEGATDDYTCPPCNLSSVHNGTVWSEQITVGKEKNRVKNTCPIDNGLTGLVIHKMSRHPEILDTFPKDDAHEALKEAISCLEEKNSYKAHQTLLDMYQRRKEKVQESSEYKKHQEKLKEVEKKNAKITAQNKKKAKKDWKPTIPEPKTDLILPYGNIDLKRKCLFGEHSVLWSETFQKGCTFIFESNCSDCNHPVSFTDTSVPLTPINMDDTVSNFIEKTTKEGYDFPCTHKKCQGQRHLNPIQADGNPWMLTIDLQTLPESHHATFRNEIISGTLPKTLEISGNTYQLSHIVLNIPRVHFVSIHHDPKTNRWAYYDGQADNRRDHSRTALNYTLSSKSTIQC